MHLNRKSIVLQQVIILLNVVALVFIFFLFVLYHVHASQCYNFPSYRIVNIII